MEAQYLKSTTIWICVNTTADKLNKPNNTENVIGNLLFKLPSFQLEGTTAGVSQACLDSHWIPSANLSFKTYLSTQISVPTLPPKKQSSSKGGKNGEEKIKTMALQQIQVTVWKFKSRNIFAVSQNTTDVHVCITYTTCSLYSLVWFSWCLS